MKTLRTSFLLLAFALFMILAFSAFASDAEDPELKDPELKQCKHQCRAQQEIDEEEIQECSRRCDAYHKEKMKREREEKGGAGSGSSQPWEERTSAEEQQEQEQEQEQGQEDNPYVFRDHHFTAKFQTQRGSYRVLPKFTQRSKKLFKGIENIRLGILEAEPRTFTVPNHCDADAVSLVIQGEATLSLVREDKRESFNVKQGDIVKIPSGITMYTVNRNKNQKFIMADLLFPVSNPGELEAFFPAGSQEPESYLRAFTPEILAAALNRRTEELRNTILGSGQQQQQRREPFMEVSEEQIQAFSQHGEGGIWPFRGESRETINILEKSPSHSNKFGRLQEVDFRDFRDLQDVNVAISYANITQGGMLGPLFNSRITQVSLVVNGYGTWEMSCPHLSSEHQGSSHGAPRYQRASARLSPGVVFVVPPGHPYLALASKDQNLEIVSFKLNANGNERFLLAGKRNVIIQLERPAKELSFGGPAKSVDKIYGSQKEEYFFMGPQLRQQQGREREGEGEGIAEA